MSEFLNVPSMLGLIGAFAGVIALVISGLTYNYQKPSLKVKVRCCVHHYQKSDLFTPEMEIRFLTSLEMKNQGDRGTTVSQIVLSFVDNGKKNILTYPTYGKQTEGTGNMGQKITQVEYRWVNPSETAGLTPIFLFEFTGSEKDQKEEIECIFTVYSTRKNYKIKYTSKKDAEFNPLKFMLK